jgi:glyoxylase-like metal-dependent hydrolase (beta-lactamase superfamily II)
MKEVAPGIYLESAFPPYNLVVIQTQDSVVAVDIPPNPIHATSWHDKILETFGHIDFAILTDASLNRQIAAMLWDTPMITSNKMYRKLVRNRDERARRDLLQQFADKYPESGQLTAQLQLDKPSLAFTHRLLIHTRTPPLHLEIIDGAAPGSLWLMIPDLSLLVAGDTVCIDEVPPFSDVVDSKAWLSTLASLSRRQSIKTIIPGRGSAPVQRGDIEKEREFLRVMRRSARKLARASSASANTDEMARDLAQIFYSNLGQHAVKMIEAGLEKLIQEIDIVRNSPEIETTE